MTNTPAGWYRDAQGAMRWWDGYQWTHHVQPAQPAQQLVQVRPAPQVVVNQRKVYKTSHAFHLIMSIVTLGLWLPVWLIVGIMNAARS